jgi:hypothetical protein
MSGPLSLVYPVLAQVLITFVVMVWTAKHRVGAVRARRVRMADIALSDAAWPEDARKASNNLRNQFETPVLFYVLCGVATFIGATGILMTLLAWAYVATRVVHAFIHLTSNYIPHRFYAFAVGAAILFAMWIVVVVRLLAS